MTDKQDPEKYLIIFRCVVVMNLLYLGYQINSFISFLDFYPTQIETHIGLVSRLPFFHLAVNALMLTYCLFINHWFVVLMYVFVLMLQLYFAVVNDHIFMSQYSYAETALGGLVLVVYAWYRWIEKKEEKAIDNEPI